MNKISIILLMILATSANADVFKCRLADKTVYQATPCPPDVIEQQVLDIQQMPVDKAIEAEQRLDTWKSELAVREAAERQAKKERQEMLDKRAAIDALKRSAEAQEALAEANRQPIVINQPPVYIRSPPRFIRDKPDDRPNRPMPGRLSRDPVTPRQNRWITP